MPSSSRRPAISARYRSRQGLAGRRVAGVGHRQAPPTGPVPLPARLHARPPARVGRGRPPRVRPSRFARAPRPRVSRGRGSPSGVPPIIAAAPTARGPRQADLAAGLGVGLAGHPDDPPRQPTGKDEEVQLPGVAGEPPQLAERPASCHPRDTAREPCGMIGSSGERGRKPAGRSRSAPGPWRCATALRDAAARRRRTNVRGAGRAASGRRRRRPGSPGRAAARTRRRPAAAGRRAGRSPGPGGR